MNDLPTHKTRILVCGSRNWTDKDTIADTLADFYGQDVEIIHGGAQGADTLAGEVAEFYGYPVRVFRPDYDRYGRRAPLERNLAMLDENPSLVVAFTLGTTGTAHTITNAHRRGIPVRIEGRS